MVELKKNFAWTSEATSAREKFSFRGVKNIEKLIKTQKCPAACENSCLVLHALEIFSSSYQQQHGFFLQGKSSHDAFSKTVSTFVKLSYRIFFLLSLYYAVQWRRKESWNLMKAYRFRLCCNNNDKHSSPSFNFVLIQAIVLEKCEWLSQIDHLHTRKLLSLSLFNFVNVHFELSYW